MLNKRDIATISFLILGAVILSLVQLFSDRSLYLDESSLSINIASRSVSGLLEPLEYQQIAPVGFLLLEKFVFELVNKSGSALRIIPYVFYLLTIPLVFIFSKQLKLSSVCSAIVTFFVASNWTMIRMSSEIKQYSGDVFWGLLIANILVYIAKNKCNYQIKILVSLVLAMALCFSNVSVIYIFWGGLFLLYFKRKEILENDFSSIFILVTPFLFFLVNYYLFYHDHPTSDFMRRFWKDSFIPLNPFSANSYRVFADNIYMLFRVDFGLGKWLVYPGIITFLAGIILLVKRRSWEVIYWVLGASFVQLILSGFELYPFGGRVMLHAFPFLFIAIAVIIESVVQWLRLKLNFLNIVPMYACLGIFLVPTLTQYPYKFQESKEALLFIRQHLDNSDGIILTQAMQRAAAFYTISDEIAFPEEYTVLDQKATRETAREAITNMQLDTIWVGSSHIFIEPEPNKTIETIIVEEAHGHGYELAQKVLFPGAKVMKFQRVGSLDGAE